MFAHHRDFLYKRGHLDLAARAKQSSLIPDVISNSVSLSSPSPSVDPNQSGDNGPLTLPTVLKTTDTPTPTPSSSSNTPSSSTPSPSSASDSASSSSTPSSTSPASASSSNGNSSSTTRTVPSVSSTPPTVATSTSAYAFSGTTQVDPGISLTPLSSLSPTTTSTPGSSGATHTSTIVGGVAGTLAGIAAVGLLLIWCMRRQRSRDIDDFDAQAFKRQSTVLVDDHVEPSRSYNPRPPTMIEHHNVSPALAAQAGYGGQNFYGNYGGYSEQPSYASPEMIRPIRSPPPQTYATQPMGYAGYEAQQQIVRHPSNVGHTTYEAQQQLARQPSNAGYLTRQPGSVTGYGTTTASPGSLDPNAQYIDLNRSSVSPYQAVQYADISRRLGSANPNTEVPHESVDLPDDPLPSPFDDPPEVTPVPAASPNAYMSHSTSMAAPGGVAVAPHSLAEPHQRPITVYGESDAYGGI